MRRVNIFKMLLGSLAAAGLIAGSTIPALASDGGDRGHDGHETTVRHGQRESEEPSLSQVPYFGGPAPVIIVNPVDAPNPHDDWRQEGRSIAPVVGRQAEV